MCFRGRRERERVDGVSSKWGPKEKKKASPPHKKKEKKKPLTHEGLIKGGKNPKIKRGSSS